MTPEEKLERLWTAIEKLSSALNVVPLKNVGALLRIELDNTWALEINGTKETINGIEPYTMRVYFNDWPAGIIYPMEAVIADGSAANVDTLTTAIESRIKDADKSTKERIPGKMVISW